MSTTPAPATPRRSNEPRALRKLLWVGIAAALAGTWAVLLIGRLLHSADYQSLVFIPWMVVLILLVPAAYRQGFRDGKSEPRV